MITRTDICAAASEPTAAVPTSGLAPAARAAIAVVGNAPDLGDHAAKIDSCGTVIRFNNAPGFGGAAGRRVTHLALVNRGGQPREWVDEGFARLPALREASEVILPFPRLIDGPPDICWTREMQERLVPFGVRTRTLRGDLHERARRVLRGLGAPGRIDPSTGFLVVFDLLDGRRPDRPIEIFGFGFAGWEGHPWQAERRWFEAAHSRGDLVLHPVP